MEGSPAPATVVQQVVPMTTVQPVAPMTTVQPVAPAVDNAQPSTSAPRTFQETNKPASDNTPALKPIPQPEAAPSSLPTPSLPDPNNRTAFRSAYPAVRVQWAARPVEEVPLRDDGGWRPAKN
jgi:hypothetical protein